MVEALMFEELPDWTFDVAEVSTGVYRVIGKNSIGQEITETGIDPELVLGNCRNKALAMAA